MHDIILQLYTRYPDEAAVIGRLLAGYGELEFDVCHCVSVATGDFDAVFKAMFRARAAKDRIDVADALGRKHFQRLGRGSEFSEAIANTHFCRTIRNQFAHCHWHDDNTGYVGFARLDNIASKHRLVNPRRLTIRHIDLELLQKQETYFRFTSNALAYLNWEARHPGGSPKDNPFSELPKLPRPDPYIREGGT